MKAKISIPILAFFVAGVVFAAVTITWLNVYYKYAQVPVEEHRVGMESLISFADDNGRDSTQMKSLKDEFLAANQELKTATDQNSQTATDAAVVKLKDVVLRFKTEAKAQLTGLGVGALAKLVADQDANKYYFNSLLDDARNLHKERNTQLFDDGVAKGENAIQKLKDHGKDATQSEAKLNEIKGERGGFITSMTDVISACYGIERISCDGVANLTGTCAEKVQNYCTLRDAIKSDFLELKDLVYQAAGLK